MLWINGKMTDLTKKDAIHKLVDAKCFLERYSNPHDKWTEAINIGIEAIEIVMAQEEQEPTTKNDLGVEEINMIDKSNFSQEQYKADLQSAYDCGYNQACKDKITMPYAEPDNCGNYIEQTTKNNLEVDCIDRNSIKYYPGAGGYMYASKGEIDKLPTVIPQEPILDKLRVEIEQNAYPIVHGINNHELGMTLYGILQVIDKYKGESEVDNGNDD